MYAKTFSLHFPKYLILLKLTGFSLNNFYALFSSNSISSFTYTYNDATNLYSYFLFFFIYLHNPLFSAAYSITTWLALFLRMSWLYLSSVICHWEIEIYLESTTLCPASAVTFSKQTQWHLLPGFFNPVWEGILRKLLLNCITTNFYLSKNFCLIRYKQET